MDRALCIITLLLFCAFVTYQAQSLNCTANGRYPAPGDTNCTKYHLCVYLTANQSFASYNYTCPSPSLFDPSRSLCTTNYTCNKTSTITSVCTAEGRTANPTSTDCTGYINCIQINSTYYLEDPQTCPNTTYFNPSISECDATFKCSTNFSCSATGRFANTTDTTCKSYYLCVRLNNGSLTYYTYTCPTISVFSPLTQLCTTRYTCPTSK